MQCCLKVASNSERFVQEVDKVKVLVCEHCLLISVQIEDLFGRGGK